MWKKHGEPWPGSGRAGGLSIFAQNSMQPEELRNAGGISLKTGDVCGVT